MLVKLEAVGLRGERLLLEGTYTGTLPLDGSRVAIRHVSGPFDKLLREKREKRRQDAEIWGF
ncbi:hypothetical protein ACFQ1E_13245 [Sphingomonas canadensis]|uniref:Uncharacterized protein n=1 Tax=Sphingomonas canadensis TaxID=1219257 RepID=A0ABW3H8I1_9SPHN|nr:hypothetical protein [Sphingomonas canadensis]MCW3837036.1 hypothetical protein [Sphingomonas canadensis]